MTFRYIGSKARMADAIATRIGPPIEGGRFVDLFCGTGVVAETAAKMGWDIHLNDHLYSAVIMAAARMTGRAKAKFKALDGYDNAIRILNKARSYEGFIFQEYSPASSARIGLERRYFTKHNAAKIDGMRKLIAQWTDDALLSVHEERVLIADLMSASNRVANIAGTYGCFLSKWQRPAMENIELRARTLATYSGRVSVSVYDAAAVEVNRNDLVYLDPPYTKRQYAAYYHLLETIALGDNPIVEGVGGLRPWKHKASDFCYKTRALGALTALVGALNAERVMLSYSDDAHIPIDAITRSLKQFGKVKPNRLMEISRYRPNRVASEGMASVSEYLIELTRNFERVEA